MYIEIIKENKKAFLNLLLLADEQEDMIDRYLTGGEMFALNDDGVKSLCVVTRDENSFEIKNIATYPEYQKRGYASALIKHVSEYYKGKGENMFVGTGETPSIIRFYEHCGFERSHVLENFFTDNYDHPIIEDGIQLKDMIYLKKKL